jgi:AcrR family transcriptional regulator
MSAEASEGGAARRAAILESALRVFLRYGFKKTSMDDLARAAGLSRQGLYLHHRTKEELFKAVVSAQAESMRAARKAALAREDQSVEDRIVGAFEATHGSLVGQLGSEYVNELMDTALTLVGPSVSELDRELVTEVVRVLRSSGIAEGWKAQGLSAKDLGENLLSTSLGVKQYVTTPDEYRRKIRIAVRMICSRRSP